MNTQTSLLDESPKKIGTLSLKSALIKNFKYVKEIEVNFDSGIIYIVGKNRAGKSTLLDAIFIALKGKTAMPTHKRFKMIGADGDKAEMGVVLQDQLTGEEIEVKRTITHKDVYLKIKSNGNNIGQEYLDTIMNEFAFNPMKFTDLSPRNQAIRLGIDTSEFDQRIKQSKEERTFIGREVTNLKGNYEALKGTEKIEPINTNQIMSEISRVNEFNYEQRKLQNAVDQMRNQITAIETGIENKERYIQELIDQVEKLKEKIGTEEAYLDTMEKHESDIKAKLERMQKPEPVKSITELSEKLSKANDINEKANKYKDFQRAEQEYLDKKEKYESATEHIEEIRAEKIEYIKSANLPFQNCSVDDEGGLLISGKPFNSDFFSESEIWRIASRIIIQMDPRLTTICVPNANNLDDDTIKMFSDMSEKYEYQFLFEYVGKEKKGDHCILLKEQRVVESYDDEPENEPEKVETL